MDGRSRWARARAIARSSTSSTSPRDGPGGSARGAGSLPPVAIPQMSLAFAPDGRHLAVARGEVRDTRLRPVGAAACCCSTPGPDAPHGERRHPLRRGQWEAHVLFAPGGALITSAAQGDTIVWDARTGRIIRRYPIGGRPALSPDGRTLALALNSPNPREPRASVGVLDLRSGRRRELAHDLHDEWIMSLAFTPDGSADRRRRLRGHPRLGRRLGHDRRALPGRAANAASGGIASTAGGWRS